MNEATLGDVFGLKCTLPMYYLSIIGRGKHAILQHYHDPQELFIIGRGKHATLQLIRTEVHTGHTGSE